MMRSSNFVYDVPIWPNGTRVRLLKEDHPKSGQGGTIVAALANPSGLPEKQWYDVRFDDRAYGRFQVRYLQSIPALDCEVA